MTVTGALVASPLSGWPVAPPLLCFAAQSTVTATPELLSGALRMVASAASCENVRQPGGSAPASRLESQEGTLRDKGRTRHNGQSVAGQQAICSRQFTPASAAPQSRHLASIAPRNDSVVIAHPLPG